MNELKIDTVDTLIISIIVLYLGNVLTRLIRPLQKYSIPQAVTGGLIVSFTILIVSKLGGPQIAFAMELRDALLLAFFSTIGLSAKFSKLKEGGKPLLILLTCASVFLIVQNGTGVLLANLFGAHPGYGLFAGSVSFAGGHGTAIAWGQEAEAAGLDQAGLVGIAFATFGLIAGGIIGGPVAEMLIKKNKLDPATSDQEQPMMVSAEPEKKLEPVTMRRALSTVFTLAICISVGSLVNRFFFSAGVMLPGFLTAMMVGIIITNLSGVFKKEIRQSDFDKVGEGALQLFLAMSLMSLDLQSLASAMGVVFTVLVIQVIVITIFAVFIVFRVMGKTYDAAVICAGFTGLGLGATPVAIANMNAVTSKYGPSFQAFLVVPLVGAFFMDLINALVIKFFLGLPMMQGVM
ncbi:sodium/glutamate symporter [Pelagicoccus mobilis]|uniref:Sodium/glutamate symporter n=1 Tax=Pelagicoccus mobilis TaxID=415221 RepID=A0A934RYM8_9BACT|nr:sodium/glutamate symporter [Pelagicoccus mobilis]MBK1879137.1 sodium/glutamate symporter [Pelagicoccus mobilis]